jgi:hypothetical protein
VAAATSEVNAVGFTILTVADSQEVAMSPTDPTVSKVAPNEYFERIRKLADVLGTRPVLVGKASRRSFNIAARRLTQRPWLARLELSRYLARGPLAGGQTRSNPMFGKNDLVDSLSRDLDRVRERRDALASDVTTLTAQITEMETRLSVEKDRRERECVAGEIDDIKKQLEDTATIFTPAISRLCNATETAAAIVPEARELNSLLAAIATEVGTRVSPVLHELVRRAEAIRAGHVAPRLPRPLKGRPQSPEDSDHELRLSAWLSRKKEPGQQETAEDQRGTAA